MEHHRGEKKRTKWQGPSYFLWFLREQIQAISFSVKHETRHASSSLTPFHSLFISLAHANLLVSDHVGFAWVVESCHSSNGYGVTKPSAVISAKSLAAQRRTVAECDWPPDASFGRWSDRQLEKCIEILRDREGMSGLERNWISTGAILELDQILSLWVHIKPKLMLWISQTNDLLFGFSGRAFGNQYVELVFHLARQIQKHTYITALVRTQETQWNASHFQHIIKAIINWVSRSSPRPHVVVITLTCRQWQVKWFSLPAEWTPPL